MEENRIVLGYDLNQEFAQISYFVLGTDKPETYGFGRDGEKDNIPLCLCRRNEVNQWYYGDEAIACFRQKEGILIDRLLEKAVLGQKIVIEDEDGKTEYDPVQLLGLFIKKSFSQMGFFLGSYVVEALMITVEELDETVLEVLDGAVKGLQLPKERIYFQSRLESIYYYIIHQPKELWSYQVGIFDFSSEHLKSYRVEMNHKTKPVVTLIYPKIHTHITRKKEHASIMEKDRYLEQLDKDFLTLLSRYVEGNIMTSIYLIGDGFLGEWYKESLNFLCKGRRVFGGNNLYSKGASLAAGEKIQQSENAARYIFLGRDKLKSNVGIRMINGTDEEYQPILDAGCNWYEARTEMDFMLIEGNTVSFLITPMMGGKESVHEMVIDGFKDRPKGTVRLHLLAEMCSEREMHIKITDTGFGDFFPARDDVWEEKIILGE